MKQEHLWTCVNIELLIILDVILKNSGHIILLKIKAYIGLLHVSRAQYNIPDFKLSINPNFTHYS